MGLLPSSPLKLQLLEVVCVVGAAALGLSTTFLAKKRKRKERVFHLLGLFPMKQLYWCRWRDRAGRDPKSCSSSAGCNFFAWCSQVWGHPYLWVRAVRCSAAQGSSWLSETAQVMMLVSKGWWAKVDEQMSSGASWLQVTRHHRLDNGRMCCIGHLSPPWIWPCCCK